MRALGWALLAAGFIWGAVGAENILTDAVVSWRAPHPGLLARSLRENAPFYVLPGLVALALGTALVLAKRGGTLPSLKGPILWPVRHPALAALVVVALTAYFGGQARQLEVDTSAEGMMVEKDPERLYYEQVKQKFGSDNLTIIVVKADDVFTARVLQTVKRISEALERTEGVSRVESLTTVRNIKGEGDLLNTDPLVPEAIPTAEGALGRIRGDALGNGVFAGAIVSRDGRATAINVYTDPRAGDRRFNAGFSDRVEALIRRETAPGLTIYQIGSALTKVTLGRYIEHDQVTLIPVAVIVLLVVLLLAFRTFQGVVIPMVTGLLSIVWNLGLMAMLGLPVTVVTAIIPALLIAIGFTEDVHMISVYHRLLETGRDKLSAIVAMLEEGTGPIVVTSATTVLGFASLATTSITMLIQFGVASSLGLIANFFTTMIVVPLLLWAWPVPRRFRTRAVEGEPAEGAIPRLMERLGEFNLRCRIPIAVGSAVITAASLIGWYAVRVNTDFISYFPERSFIRQRVRDLHEAVSGVVTFSVVVETGREDGLKEPATLRRIVALQEFLAGTRRVDKTVSVADYLRKMHREMNGGEAGFEVIPDTREEVAQYLVTLEGKELAKYLDFTASTANVVVRHNITSSWELSVLLDELDAFVKRTFPAGETVRYTGETILINNAADYMAVNEVTSLSFVLALIAGIHGLLFGSIRAGVLSLIPNVIPILTTFGVMGLFGIPLNTGTALIATIAIGIAVDDTVHHMMTYSRELRAHHDRRRAVLNTMRSQGRPIIYVSLALAGGFLSLVFSEFVPTFYFAVLSAVVMLVAMVGELMLTPILMYSTPLVTLREPTPVSETIEDLEPSPVFAGFSWWETRKVLLLGALDEDGDAG